jgi:hypothetical protein
MKELDPINCIKEKTLEAIAENQAQGADQITLVVSTSDYQMFFETHDHNEDKVQLAYSMYCAVMDFYQQLYKENAEMALMSSREEYLAEKHKREGGV